MFSGSMQQKGGGLRILHEQTKDLRPAFELIDKHVTLVFQRQFTTQGSFGGQHWTPLRPSTVASRQGRGRGRGGILQDTRRLWSSLVRGRGPESFRVISRHRYERGTTVPYAMFHQLGTQRMPKRPIVPDPMPRHVTAVWERILSGYFSSLTSPGFRA